MNEPCSQVVFFNILSKTPFFLVVKRFAGDEFENSK